MMGRAAVQTDLDRLKKQAGWQLQDTSAGKCQVWSLAGITQHRLGPQQRNWVWRKGLGIPVGSKLKTRQQQCALDGQLHARPC